MDIAAVFGVGLDEAIGLLVGTGVGGGVCKDPSSIVTM